MRSDNTHSEGGRLELTITPPKGGKANRLVHYLGHGTFGWKTAGFVFEVQNDFQALRTERGVIHRAASMYRLAERNTDARIPKPSGAII